MMNGTIQASLVTAADPARFDGPDSGAAAPGDGIMRETFAAVYTEELTRAIQERPDEYCYPVERVPYVVTRMVPSLAAGTANKDGIAIRRTCKRLGIPYTYAGIRGYLAGGGAS